MEIRTNKIMDAHLQSLGYDFWEKSIPLPPALDHLLTSPILEGKGLVILKSDHQVIPEKEIADAIDKCEFESLENHFHIDQYIDREINFNSLEFLGLGLEFTKQLIHRLQSELPEKNFRVSFSFGEVEQPNIYQFGNCVTRFYVIREEAEKAFRVHNLDDYKMEGIIAIEINRRTAILAN